MKELREKIMGAVVGYCIGDALGLGTDCMTPAEIDHHYPEGLNRYNQMISDAHRAVWNVGQGTNETSLFLYLCKSIVMQGGFDREHFAEILSNWYQEGQIGLTASMRAVLSTDDFMNHTTDAAHDAWNKLGNMQESNDCLGMMIPIGIVEGDTEKMSQELTSLVHVGPRALGAGAVIALVVRALLYEDRVITPDEAKDIARKYTAELDKYVDIAVRGGDDLRNLLGEYNHPADVRKAFTAALAALWHGKSLEHTLVTIVNMGGGACANAAIAASIMGLHYGISAIPQHYIDERLNKDFIFSKAAAFADAVLGGR